MESLTRKTAIDLYTEALAEIRPEILVRKALTAEGEILRIRFLDRDIPVPLDSDGRLVLLSIGKAAAPMAAEAARLLGPRITEGLVVTKTGFSLPSPVFPTIEAGHPVPDQRGAEASEQVTEMITGLGEKDLVLVLLSGGASALLPAPLEGISLAEKQALINGMLSRAMNIHQINQVRKAISRFKGGGLAALAAPARVVTLALSDVPGDHFASIGSGPTCPEPVDAPAVIGLLQTFDLWQSAAPSIREALQTGAVQRVKGRTMPAPINGLIGNNALLLQALRNTANRHGIAAFVVDHQVTGDNREARNFLLSRWEAIRKEIPHGPLCMVAGGETVVEVTGGGMGGRCQELAALMLPEVGAEEIFLAAGSDGNDGPTDAAGGVVDQESFLRMESEQIPWRDLLREHDSYHLLERTGNLIRVSPTRNNLMDLYFFLRKR